MKLSPLLSPLFLLLPALMTGCGDTADSTRAAEIRELRGQVSEWRDRAEAAERRVQRLSTPAGTYAYIAELEAQIDDPYDLCADYDDATADPDNEYRFGRY